MKPAALLASIALLAAAAMPWLPFAGISEQEAVWVLRAGHSANVDEPYHVGLSDFARRVEAGSGGRLRIELFPQGQLGSERMMIEGLLLDTLDIAVTANGTATNFVPELVLLDQPFLFRDRDQLFDLLDGELGAALKDDAAQRGLRILGFYDAGARHIMSRAQPVATAADLAGLKVRTMPVPAHIATFNALGAQAVPIDYGELYGSLQTGLIDAAEAANTNFMRGKFFEVAPHWSLVEWTLLVANLMMSEQRFAELPAELQQLLLDAARESALLERAVYRRSDAELLEAMTAQGVYLLRPDRSSFAAVAPQIHARFLSSPRQQQRLQLVQQKPLEP